jgi:Fe-S-cluster-containing hydrogenase component 2
VRSFVPESFKVKVDNDICIRCQVCAKQCSFNALMFDDEDNRIYTNDNNCVACHRCTTLCPTKAINVVKNPLAYKENAYWLPEVIENIHKQAASGGVILTGSGNDKPFKSYFDRLLFDASQVTNPSIDPLREPMELRTYIGRKPNALTIKEDKNGNRSRRY